MSDSNGYNPGAVLRMPIQVAPLDVNQAIEEIRAMPDGLATGWAPLDQEGLAIRPGELTVVASRLGHGKTSFTLNLVWRWLSGEQEPILFFSLETPVEQLVCRFVGMIAGLGNDGRGPSAHDVQDYLRHGLDAREAWDVDPDQIDAAVQALRARQELLWIVYNPSLGPEELVPVAQSTAPRRTGARIA